MQINETINHLKLIEKKENRKGLFKCSCGTEKQIRISSVKSGSTKSCGCHRKKQAVINGKSVKTHGESKSKLYRLWADLKTKGKLSKEFYEYQNFKDWAKDKYKPGLIPFSSYKLIFCVGKHCLNLNCIFHLHASS